MWRWRWRRVWHVRRSSPPPPLWRHPPGSATGQERVGQRLHHSHSVTSVLRHSRASGGAISYSLSVHACEGGAWFERRLARSGGRWPSHAGLSQPTPTLSATPCTCHLIIAGGACTSQLGAPALNAGWGQGRSPVGGRWVCVSATHPGRPTSFQQLPAGSASRGLLLRLPQLSSVRLGEAQPLLAAVPPPPPRAGSQSSHMLLRQAGSNSLNHFVAHWAMLLRFLIANARAVCLLSTEEGGRALRAQHPRQTQPQAFPSSPQPSQQPSHTVSV